MTMWKCCKRQLTSATNCWMAKCVERSAIPLYVSHHVEFNYLTNLSVGFLTEQLAGYLVR
jgi:hypothetical protein